MKIHIQSQGFDATEALSEMIEVKLTTALGRHRHHVQGVEVRLGDENGPRGGVDKYCRLQVQLLDGGVARAADLQTDLYAAIDRASHRLSRAVAKRLKRVVSVARKEAEVASQFRRSGGAVHRSYIPGQQHG